MEGRSQLLPYIFLSFVFHLIAIFVIRPQMVVRAKTPSSLNMVLELENVRIQEEEPQDQAILKPKMIPKKETRALIQKARPAPRLDPKILESFPYPFFLDAITRKIANNWNVQEWAISRLTRRASARFKIKSSGEIQGLVLKTSSGDTQFDSACVRAIELANPFPPLPVGYAKNELSIVFDFELGS